jgi:hypothetical protein
MTFFIPESPRWYLANGHPQAAKDAINRIARFNRVSDPLNIVSFKKDEDQTEAVRAERENQDEIMIGRDKDK